MRYDLIYRSIALGREEALDHQRRRIVLVHFYNDSITGNQSARCTSHHVEAPSVSLEAAFTSSKNHRQRARRGQTLSPHEFAILQQRGVCRKLPIILQSLTGRLTSAVLCRVFVRARVCMCVLCALDAPCFRESDTLEADRSNHALCVIRLFLDSGMILSSPSARVRAHARTHAQRHGSPSCKSCVSKDGSGQPRTSTTGSAERGKRRARARVSDRMPSGGPG